MKIKTKILLLISIVLTMIKLSGQADRSNVFPPTPEMASMGKFIDQPMSLSRGIPETSIPIYNLAVSSELSYPISLQYQSGGIRVNEIAGKTGLGWNLNNTGVITRTVKDKPDDFQGSGYMYHTQDFDNIKTLFSNYDLNMKYLSETYDFEPDEYIVNANGLNFKFYYNKQTQKFIQAPLSNIRLEPSYNSAGSIVSWIVTDINGIKYYFGNNNMVDVSNFTKFITLEDSASENSNIIDSHIIAWYLVKIEDTKSNTINFTYKTKPTYQMYNKNSESYVKNISTVSTGVPVIAQNAYKSRSYTFSSISEKVLEKIEADNIEILFIDDINERKDFINSRALKEVLVKKSDKQIQKIVFDYDYFASNNSYQYDSYYYQQNDNYRLKLKGLYLYGAVGEAGNYKFEYNTINLPNRFSYAQDAWGFFNGKSNSELIPKLSLYPVFNIASQIGSADRSISSSHAQACILNKIIYPTGGSTTFEYESNRIGRVINIQDYPNHLFSSTVTKNFWLEAEKEFGPVNVTVIDKPEYRARMSITNPSGFINFNVNVEGCTTQLNNSSCMYTIKIIGVGNPTFTTITQSTLSINLPTGEYDIVAVKTGNGNSQVSGFTITAYWDEMEDIDNTNLEIGGLRVKKINFNDNNNEYLYSRTYEYMEKNIDNKMESSGKILNYPIFIEMPYYIYLPKSLKISSNSIFPLSNLSSSAVIYTHVVEKRTDKNSLHLGNTEYGYTFDERFDMLSNYTNTLRDKTDFVLGWRNGLLIYKRDYDKFDNKVRTLLNSYSSKNKIRIENFGAVFEPREMTGALNPTNIIENQLYRYFFYPFVTDVFNIDKSETIDYLNGKTVKTETEYFYNNPNHYQVTSQKTNQPDQSIQESTYQYAHEKGNQLMIDKNMIGIPLETSTTQTKGSITKILSKTETIYPKTVAEITNNNFSLVLPKSALSYDLQTGASPSIEVTYDKYDSKGNLQQYTGKNGVSTTIIWGYNQTQPIAKIEGAKLSDIPQSLIDAVVTASVNDAQQGTDASEQNLIDALNTFRNNTALSAYQISTYTYDPLIGVKSITPPSGIREIYVYDNANRLKEIKQLDKDASGSPVYKILKEFKYNYKQ
ncbi:hypothetical protein ACM46_22660 [Chryseobacterium angstadtii]|uniref:Sugar-binding protein n=1 Tax=Chryseobacterium angstadtii TaxID=558151 RepID=A0A0J7HY86_9FLAO|nr:hypothetical protein [Chryseobacterium angstadtii]KMQ58501.1 hypothetical protein ACM46_22660 [Chryseobacterium angstadtii]